MADFYDSVTMGQGWVALEPDGRIRMENPNGDLTHPSNATGVMEWAQVSTYAAMLALNNLRNMTEVLVVNDEDKGQTNTVYHLWPNGTRMWVAGIKEN